MTTANITKPAWLPLYYTEPQNKAGDYSDLIAEFSATFLKAIDGFKAGEPLILAKWQKWLMSNISAFREDGRWCTTTDVILIPRKNGKTTLIAIVVLFSLLTAPSNSQIFSAAKDREQAALVFNMLRTWIAGNAYLRQAFHVERSKKRIIFKQTSTSYQALSADAGAANGLNPYMIIADELHAWEGMTTNARAREFWGALTSGGGAQKNYKLIVISTAGSNKDDSILGELYKRGRTIASGESDDSSFGFFCWEAPPEADVLDEAAWVSANPNLAEGLMSFDFFRAELKSKLITGVHVFKRMQLNQWVSMVGAPFIEPAFFLAAERRDKKIPEGNWVVAGFDGSLTGDSTAIVVMDLKTGLFDIHALWERPENAPADWRIQKDEVEASFVELHRKYQVADIWADRAYFEEDLIKWGLRYGWKITSIPQTRARMTQLGVAWKQDIAEADIFHNGNPHLKAHVGNAVLGRDGGYYKESKGSRKKIDLLVASILANGAKDFHRNHTTTYTKTNLIRR